MNRKSGSNDASSYGHGSSMMSNQTMPESTAFAAAASVRKTKKNYAKTPTKKFASRAEEFCAFMTSLGYEIPKYTKPEHYDYLFQDEETAKIARHMMKEIKPRNVLEREEIERFNKLKSDGRVLYGIDLENALERKKNREIQRARSDQAVIDRDNELDRIIAEKEQQIRQINAFHTVVDEAIRQRERGDRIKKNMEESRQKHSERLDQEIQARRKELAHLTEALQAKFEAIHLSISSKCEVNNPVRLCDMDWLKMLDEEEKLHCAVQSMVEKYGADLLKEEVGVGHNHGGVGVEGAAFGRPIESEAMYRMIKQHQSHLERLKHVIIHERIREINMDIEMAGCQAILENVNQITEQAELLSQADPAVRSRMLQEIKKTTESLQATFQLEKSILLEEERQDEAARLNAEVKEIVDIRSRVKRKSHEFFAFIVNVLVHQRVRVDLIRELIRAERSKNLKFANKLQDYRNSALHMAQNEESLQAELTGAPHIEPELIETFEKYKIPLSFYQNPLTRYQALLSVQSCAKREKEMMEIKDEQEFQFKKKKMFEQIDTLEKLMQNVKMQVNAKKSPMEMAMAEVEQVHRDMQNKLNYHELNKEDLAQKAIKKKWDLIHNVEEMLANHNKNSEQNASYNPNYPAETTAYDFSITDH